MRRHLPLPPPTLDVSHPPLPVQPHPSFPHGCSREIEAANAAVMTEIQYNDRDSFIMAQKVYNDGESVCYCYS